MKTILAVVVMILALHPGGNFVAFSQEVDPLSEGNRYFEARQYNAAADIYGRLVKSDLDIPTKAKALFNLGVTYQRLGQHDDAINAFTQILSMNVNDREPGGHIMEAYRNYRPRAQWLIGRILFEKGDYKGALEAYQSSRLKYPHESWCNVALEAARHRYALHEGLTYEHLGLYTEAVNAYLRDYIPRVAELYEAAGQLDDLKRFIDKKDEESYQNATELARRKFSREEMKKYHPTQKLRVMLNFYALAHAQNWPALIQRLRKDNDLGGQDLVIRVLARYPDETVPLLKDELGRPEIYQEFVYKALGLAGTPDAVATLKSRARKDGSTQLFALIHALSLAGEPGEQALAELDQVARNNLRFAIDQYKSGELQDTNEQIRFPPIPANLRLPKEF